jgi:hypothetical protein
MSRPQKIRRLSDARRRDATPLRRPGGRTILALGEARAVRSTRIFGLGSVAGMMAAQKGKLLQTPRLVLTHSLPISAGRVQVRWLVLFILYLS